LTFSPDGKYAFVAVAGQNRVAVVDAQRREVISYIDVGTNPKRNLVISVRDRKD
jgi:YVTN family beta-propeller protein